MSKLVGAREMDKLLGELPKAAQKKVLRSALREGGKLIVKAARQRVPVASGDLKRSMGQGVKKEAKTVVTIAVGPRPRKGGRHGHLVEFGTGERVDPTTGKSSGMMPAQPFLRPAYEEKKQAALDRIGEVLGEKIMKEAERLSVKARARG